MTVERIPLTDIAYTVRERMEAARALVAYKDDDPDVQTWARIAVMAWLYRRRTNPEYTLDEAFDLDDNAFEFTTADDPGEVSAAANGGSPQLSPVSGA